MIPAADCTPAATARDPAASPGPLAWRVLESLRIARELRSWWEGAHRTNAFADRFPLVRSFNRPVAAFGFLENVVVDGRPTGVMGLTQEMLYDDLTPGHGSRSAPQLGAFVLRYLLRVSDFRVPDAWVEEDDYEERSPVSWCPSAKPAFSGFGYSQHDFCLLDGTTGRFSDAEANRIVDLRELGTHYAWVAARVRIFDLHIRLQPFGPGTPALHIPLEHSSTIVLAPEFVVCRSGPRPGIDAEFGLGYALLPDDDDGDGFLAYGPGRFSFGFQTVAFELLSSGQVRVRMTFVVNRPDALIRVPLDPIRWLWAIWDFWTLGAASAWLAELRQWMLANAIDMDFDPLLWSVDLLNVATGGVAGRELCISREHLEKQMLLQHFMQHYAMITGSLSTWRQFADWTNEPSLPAWVVNGRAA